MNRRTFDLILAEVVGIAFAAVGVRLWANYRLSQGGSGVLYEGAKMAKVVAA